MSLTTIVDEFSIKFLDSTTGEISKKDSFEPQYSISPPTPQITQITAVGVVIVQWNATMIIPVDRDGSEDR